MKKIQKEASTQEDKEHRKALIRARKELEAKDSAVLAEQNERLKTQEATIQAEVDVEFQKYLAQEAQMEQEEEARIKAAREARKSHFFEFRKKSVPALKSNTGGRKVKTEEFMMNREKYAFSRKEVASGTFSNIYEATDPNKRQIVVKVILLKSLDPQYRFRFMGSYNTLRFLIEHPHPNLVPIVEVFESPEKVYVFMDRMVPGDLLARIKREGPFPEAVALKWCRGVGEGLLYLHSIGIAHENIKPESIMFDAKGAPRIGGLGWSVVYFDPEKDEVMKPNGSSKSKFHHHMAPERMKDDPYDPTKADVWSFGVLIVILLTKEWPFQFKNRHRRDIQWKLAFKKTKIPLTDSIWSILEKCFHEKPTSRSTLLEVMNMFPDEQSAVPPPAPASPSVQSN